MNMRTEHEHQGKMCSGSGVIAWTMDTLYKQSVEYCCGSLSSSLVNYTTHVPHQISAFEIYCLCCYWTLVQWLPQQYQSYRKYIYFRVGQLQCVHRLQSVVYKVNQFVLETLSSSSMLFNIKSRLLFSLKDLSYNISYNEMDVRESVCLIPILLPRSTEFLGKRIVD